MSKQTINIGASPNDGTGTPLRTSFDYTNQNFTEIYTALGGGVALPGATTQVIFNDGGTNLAGDAGLVYNKTTDALTVAGLVTAGSATITGDLTVDTSTLKVDSTNNRVGIGTASPSVTLDVAGVTQVTSGSAGGLYQWAYGASASSRSWRAWDDVTANGDFQISTSTTRTGSTYSDRYRIDVTGVHEWSNTSGLAMTLNSSGNVGIGVTPSASWSSDTKAIQLGGSTFSAFAADIRFLGLANALYDGTNYKYINNGSALQYRMTGGTGKHEWYNAAGGIAGNNITFTQAMTLDESGNLLVGTTSGTLSRIISSFLSSSGNGGIKLIDSQSNNTAVFANFSNGTGTLGSITNNNNAGVLYNVTSDKRLKENISDSESASLLIDSLQVRKFDWKANNSHQRYGFIAQELVTVVPEAVYQPTNSDDMMAVDYSKLVPMLVKEIQSLRTRVQTLESR